MKNTRGLFGFLGVAIVGIALSCPAYAWPPTFGGEFTFTNPAIQAAQEGSFVNSDQSEGARDRMAEILKTRCAGGECTLETIQNHYGVDTVRVTYRDGWWFQVSTDPAVVEVQTKAATYEQLLAMKERIQKDIFDVAKQAGMTPHENTGGGHIHIGMTSALDDSALLFRNFDADFENHSELSSGILSHDHSNSPPVAALTTEQKTKFAKVLADFDHGRLRTVRAFAKRLQADVYAQTPSGWDPPEKYHALNVTRIAGDDFPEAEKTFEVRSIRPQQSANDFLLETHLFEMRLLRLKQELRPIHYYENPAPLTEAMKAARFYEYVHDAGLNWDDYKKWVPEQLQQTAPTLQCDLVLSSGAVGNL